MDVTLCDRGDDDGLSLARYQNGYAYIDPSAHLSIYRDPAVFGLHGVGPYTLIHTTGEQNFYTTRPDALNISAAPIYSAIYADPVSNINYGAVPQVGTIYSNSPTHLNFDAAPLSGTIYASPLAEMAVNGGTFALNSYAQPLRLTTPDLCLATNPTSMYLQAAVPDMATYFEPLSPQAAFYPGHASMSLLRGQENVSHVDRLLGISTDLGVQRLVSTLSGWDNFETMPDGSLRFKTTLGTERLSSYTYKPKVLDSGNVRSLSGISHWEYPEKPNYISGAIVSSSISISTPIKQDTHSLIYPKSYAWRPVSTLKGYSFGSWTGKTIPALILKWKKPSDPLLSRRTRQALRLAMYRCQQRRVAPKDEITRNSPVESHDRTSWTLCASPARSQIDALAA